VVVSIVDNDNDNDNEGSDTSAVLYEALKGSRDF
jgi:hypothetical protein